MLEVPATRLDVLFNLAGEVSTNQVVVESPCAILLHAEPLSAAKNLIVVRASSPSRSWNQRNCSDH